MNYNEFSRRGFLKSIAGLFGSYFTIPNQPEKQIRQQEPRYTEWCATIKDKDTTRKALVSKFKSKLYEIVLDENGRGCGAGIELNPNCLSKEDLKYFKSV